VELFDKKICAVTPYLGSIVAAAMATVLAMGLNFILNESDAVMIYLAVSVFVAIQFGRGPSILFSILSCALYNFFFIEPLYTFEIYNSSAWLTLLVMLITSIVISSQAINLRHHEDFAKKSRMDAENEKLRNLLLSSVSHDLRTPLASITGASSSIAQDADRMQRETIKDLALSINQEAKRLGHIVSNLLDITKIESGPILLNRQPYFIDELIGAALSHIQPLSIHHHFETKVDANLPLVNIDGLLIEQVLSNLLENAVKYTPDGSVITVRARLSDSHIEISVIDNGTGLPAGDEKKVFEKFYTGHRNKGGTGLGLSICEGIIKAHDGKIWAENSAGGGATFSFTLPLASPVAKGDANG
jgi:two-component system sensor histidine kinase KdpD